MENPCYIVGCVLQMNKRFFIHKITIYHTEDDENYSLQHFEKFILGIIKRLIWLINGLEKGSTGSITIPTTEKLNIATNDYIVEGIINDEFDLSNLQEKYQIFKVVSVDDNRKGGLQHYKIGVSE